MSNLQDRCSFLLRKVLVETTPRVKDERGGVLVWVAMMMVCLLGMAAFVVDIGHAFFTYQQLVASTQAAALAGAEALPNNTLALSQAASYSALSGNLNANSNLSGVSMVSGYPLLRCSSTLSNQGVACDAPANANEVQVVQTLSMPTFFAGVLGIHHMTLTAQASAAAKGSYSTPYNIAVIIDNTASMASNNSDSCTDPISGSSYTTSIECALVGLKILLLNTAPCVASATTCPTSGTTNAVDMISIFTFPNMNANTMANDYTSPCDGPTHSSTYGYPNVTLTDTTYAPTGSNPSYQVTPFLSNFRTSDASNSLNTASTSYLVQLLGSSIGGATGCKGMQAPGGLETYYAGALAAAQAALLQNQALSGRGSSLNAIILLSDGAANSTDMATSYVNSQGKTVTVTNGTTYPSLNNQCLQATKVAQSIAATGTKIYSVAYGSSTSSSDCTTDTTGITPCQAMQEIASSYWQTPSSTATFFSDTAKSGSDAGCTSTLQPETGLANIFGAIATGFTAPRLIPNNTP
jgi:hypothetical protein